MKCLACGQKDLFEVLDLGKQPLANNYGETKKYELKIMGCANCDHAQLSKFVNPKKLFSHYLYESGTSETLRKWFEDFATGITALYGQGTILDIASNDGTFLRECKKQGWTVMGVDPAENLKPKDIPTMTEFFGEHSELGKYDVITAFNVVAHTPNPLSIMKGIRKHLKPGGRAFVMTSQGSQFDTGQFDTIYHEHHSYFTPTSMATLVTRAGLELVDVTVQPIHGGSLLFEIANNHVDFDNFARKALKVIDAAKKLKADGKMVGVGAAAKGVVFLNATGMQLAYVMDEAELKWGHNIPGTDIPVVSPQVLADDPEDLNIVVLAWNFYDELVSKVKKLRPNKNDKFTRFFK